LNNIWIEELDKKSRLYEKKAKCFPIGETLEKRAKYK
jgi:hypothetical protein